jgi:cell division septum initiation protein DivIVA
MRGYDPAEVRAFLERVGEELSDLQKNVAQLQERIASADAKLAAFHELEKSLRDALVSAQENAKYSKEQAEIERQNVLREAGLEAETIKLSAEREVMSIREELRELKIHRDTYIKRLRFLLKSQHELMDLIENESPDLPR